MTFQSKIGILEIAVIIFNYIFLKGFRINKFPMCLTVLIIFFGGAEREYYMVEIKNDLLVATEQSSMLSSAISELDNSNSVTKDTQSKISGNDKAKELIEKSLDISKAVSQAMKTMSNNLLMTSQSFHEKDVQLENQIDNLQLGNNEGFTLNGPIKQ